MLIQSHNSNINFGIRKRYGNPGDTNIHDQLLGQVFPVDTGITMADRAELRRRTGELIKLQHPYIGPLHPSYSSKFDGDIKQYKPLPMPDADYLKLEQNITEKGAGGWNNAWRFIQDTFGNQVMDIHRTIMPIDENSPEYIRHLIDTHGVFAQGFEAEINSGSNRLKKIAKSNEGTIFVFNHPNLYQDVNLISGFISELYKEYSNEGKEATCPRPRFIVSDTFDRHPAPLVEIYKKIGLFTINPAPLPSLKRFDDNREKIQQLAEGFAANKYNIFTCPEGKRNTFAGEMPLDQRFQCGVGSFIRRVLQNQDRVKVVVVGIQNKNHQGTLHIGNEMYFERHGDEISVTKGVINASSVKKSHPEFYQHLAKISDNEALRIVSDGSAIKLDDKITPRIISGILSTSVGICTKKAAKTHLKHFG